MRRLLAVVVVAVLAAVLCGSSQAAASSTADPVHRLVSHGGAGRAGVRHDTQISSNWSGYAITGQSFSDIQGKWVVPEVNCSESDSYSSYWIGLGGFLSGSALEQTGTDSYCLNGQQVFDAWYEIIPAPPVEFELTVAAGDTVSAEVSVAGTQTTLILTDQTTGQTAQTTVEVDAPDVSAAEWVAEAPAQCPAGQPCQVLPLADFGTMTFSDAKASSAAGHTGTISDPSWQQTAITLEQDGTYAVPSSLARDGSGFAVAYETGSPVPPAAPVVVVPPTTTPPPTVKPKPAKPKAKAHQRTKKAHRHRRHAA